MNKQDLIDLLATSPKHAAKLRPFKKADLERFMEEQTDPANDSPVKAGDFVHCEWAGSSGIVTSTERIPGSGNRFGLRVKTGASSVLDTEASDVRKA